MARHIIIKYIVYIELLLTGWLKMFFNEFNITKQHDSKFVGKL